MRLRGSYRLQILLGGLPGLTFGEEAASHAILVVSNALYFAALFYPVYSMVTMDRVVEASRCRLMKTVLILSVTLHFLLALFFALVMQA